VANTTLRAGRGSTEAELPRLYQAFHRAGNVGETPGTGLGLVIVKRCVDLHGGSIVVKSRPGEGTAFTVSLPLFPA
jgi:signal transduction histidine kinase